MAINYISWWNWTTPRKWPTCNKLAINVWKRICAVIFLLVYICIDVEDPIIMRENLDCSNRFKEEFEDTIGVVKIRKSKKNRQHNGQKKKNRQHNDQKKKDKQHIGQKKKNRQHND